MLKKITVALLFSLLSTFYAFAQSGVAVKQSGNVTPNTVPWWITSGVIGSGVTAADSPISSFGATGPVCSNSARQASGAWNSLCFQAYTNSAATISLQNYGSAPAQGLVFVVNGVQFPLPAGSSTPSIFPNGVIGGGSDVNYYVATTGNDANTCLSITTPCLTLQGAWAKLIVSNYGLGIATVNVADGTYSAGVTNFAGTWMGAGPIQIIGNVSQPGNVIINSGGANAFVIQNTPVTLSGMEIRTTTSHAGILAVRGGDVSFSNIRFGGDGTGNHMTVQNGGRIHCIGSYQIVSGGESHVHSFNRGYLDAPAGGCVGALTGVYNFTSYFAGTSDGDIDFSGWTFTGTATGTKFFSHDGGRIKSSGVGLSGLPGSTAGSLRVLGQYDDFFGGPNAQITANNNTADGPVTDLASQIQTVAADSAFGGMTMDAFANQTHITGAVSFGTNLNKLAVSSTFPVLALRGTAFDGSTYGALASMDINTTAAVTPSDHGGYFSWRTVPPGSTTLVEQMTVGKGTGGVTIGNGINPQGPGTLNVLNSLSIDSTEIIDNTSWVDYTPAAITPQGGALTGATVTAAGKWKRSNGKTIVCTITVTITNIGSGSPTGNVFVTLPVASKTSVGSIYVGSSFESVSTGNGGIASVVGPFTPTLMVIKNVSAATYWVNGYAVTGQVEYEIP